MNEFDVQRYLHNNGIWGYATHSHGDYYWVLIPAYDVSSYEKLYFNRVTGLTTSKYLIPFRFRPNNKQEGWYQFVVEVEEIEGK